MWPLAGQCTLMLFRWTGKYQHLSTLYQRVTSTFKAFANTFNASTHPFVLIKFNNGLSIFTPLTFQQLFQCFQCRVQSLANQRISVCFLLMGSLQFIIHDLSRDNIEQQLSLSGDKVAYQGSNPSSNYFLEKGFVSCSSHRLNWLGEHWALLDSQHYQKILIHIHNESRWYFCQSEVSWIYNPLINFEAGTR